jgi:hypothetical protein
LRKEDLAEEEPEFPPITGFRHSAPPSFQPPTPSSILPEHLPTLIYAVLLIAMTLSAIYLHTLITYILRREDAHRPALQRLEVPSAYEIK